MLSIIDYSIVIGVCLFKVRRKEHQQMLYLLFIIALKILIISASDKCCQVNGEIIEYKIFKLFL